MDIIERTRMDSDTMMSMLLGDDGKLEACLKTLLKVVLDKFPKCSKRMKETLSKTIEHGDKASKHAMLFFGMYRCTDWCRTLLKENNIPPMKFKRFFEDGLKKNTHNLLTGNIICIQDYVEETRKEYIVT